MEHFIVDFSPIAFSFGPLQIHWYGIMYAIGFFITFWYLKYAYKTVEEYNNELHWDILFALFLGVMIGGRLGFVIIYNLPYFFQHPLEILAFWNGGMSFHGGAIGVSIAVAWIAKRKKLNIAKLFDISVVIAPITLFFGRLGNFINGELYGSASDTPWAMIFPQSGTNIPRHPTQLYEAFLEGIVLFAILYFLRKWQSKADSPKYGIISAAFLFFYGIFRFAIEYLRIPDTYLSEEPLRILGFSTGQWLSIIMMAIGLSIFYSLRKKKQ